MPGDSGKIMNNDSLRQSTSGDRHGYARVTAIAMVASTVIVFLLFYIYRVQVKFYAKEAVETFGYPALFLLCLAADAIIQPIPPDVWVFGTAFGGADVFKTALVAGLSSSLGGVAGFYMGKFFGPWRFRRIFGSKLLRGGRNLFRDHGALAIFVAGVTPIPYSATCWVGGIYNMALYKVFLASIISRSLRYLGVAWFANFF